MRSFHYFFCDWKSNHRNLKSQLLLVLFRMVSLSIRLPVFWLLALPLWLFYKLYGELLLKVELSPRTVVGHSLHLPHPFCIVINSNARIGAECTIRHGVTLGVKSVGESGCPTLGDKVELGCGVVILGPVTIGDRSILGANVVVTKDIEPSAVVLGASARIRAKQTEVVQDRQA